MKKTCEGSTQGRCGLPQKKFSLQGYCEENVGDRSPLPAPILQGRQQRGAQHITPGVAYPEEWLEVVLRDFSSHISFQPAITPGWLPMFYG